jgi:hypothetical protein
MLAPAAGLADDTASNIVKNIDHMLSTNTYHVLL